MRTRVSEGDRIPKLADLPHRGRAGDDNIATDRPKRELAARRLNLLTPSPRHATLHRWT